MQPHDFDHLPQPEWNDLDAAVFAVAQLRDAHDRASAEEAHDQFLWAVGNNHAGTYFPVVLATLEELKRLLVGGGFWSQRAVMECLIDLGGTFIPEAGYESHGGIDVESTLRAGIQAMRPLVLTLAFGGDARARSAADLIELIDDRTLSSR